MTGYGGNTAVGDHAMFSNMSETASSPPSGTGGPERSVGLQALKARLERSEFRLGTVVNP